MANHPNRGWRSRWAVSLADSTATHRDGWVLRFVADPAEPGALDGECIGQPSPLTAAHLRAAPRIAQEAGQIYSEALRDRH